MYKILFNRSAAKEYTILDDTLQRRIDEKISLLQKGDFHMLDIKKIQGKDDWYRLRIGDYRIIYIKENTILTITLIKIGHRRDIY